MPAEDSGKRNAGAAPLSKRSMETRSVARNVLVAIGLATLALFLWKVLPVLMLAFAGVVLASAIHAGSEPLSRRLHVPDAIGVAIVVLLFAAFLSAVGWLFGTGIAAQTEELSDTLPRAFASVQSYLERTELGQHVAGEIGSIVSAQNMARVAKGTVTVFGGVLDLLLVLVLSLYLAANPESYRRGALHLLPPRSRRRVAAALADAGSKLRRWLLGQLASMVVVGIATGIGLALAGVPMPFALGVLSGILDFVPVIGPLVAAIPGVLVGFAQGPDVAMWAAVVYLVVQFCEGHFIVPLVQRWAVSLPPAVGLLGAVVFGLLFGVIGVLFAMPLLVVVVSLVQDLYVRRLEEDSMAQAEAGHPPCSEGSNSP
jgi:predicted PurR-regulated permease PerM